MNAKTTPVTLVANGVCRAFDLEHAERLLRMPHNGGWQLPANSQYEWVDNGLRYRKDKKRDSGK